MGWADPGWEDEFWELIVYSLVSGSDLYKCLECYECSLHSEVDLVCFQYERIFNFFTAGTMASRSSISKISRRSLAKAWNAGKNSSCSSNFLIILFKTYTVYKKAPPLEHLLEIGFFTQYSTEQKVPVVSKTMEGAERPERRYEKLNCQII